MIFGITGNFRKKEYLEIVDILYKYLIKNGHKCYVSDDFLSSYSKSKILKFQTLGIRALAKNSDIILSIGGDGTILSTVRRIKKLIKPILGIHIGGLGFLAESTKHSMLDALNIIDQGNYVIEERMLLDLAIFEPNGTKKTYTALNDIVIDHGSSGRILKTEILVSGNYLNTYESDGIIFCTPTGSTAYSLSAGGPIITPTIDTITVTPICPHSLSARPIILPSTELISASFGENSNKISCTIDGQVRFSIKNDTKLDLFKLDKLVSL